MSLQEISHSGQPVGKGGSFHDFAAGVCPQYG